MNKDIKENLDEYVKARKERDKLQTKTLMDILTHDCGLTYLEIETYYHTHK